MRAPLDNFNAFRECGNLRLKLWECPPFLFILMGFFIIMAMAGTYLITSRYYTEELQIVTVVGITVFLLIIGNLVITGFDKIARAYRMQSEFISIISHQLRSPLSIVKWTVETAQRETKEKTVLEDPAPVLETIENMTRRMVHLVNSLLEVKRIEARSLVLKREPLSLEMITRGIVADFQKYAAASNVALAVSVEAGLPQVMGDHDRVSIVVHNLIDNAIRYSNGKGVVEIKLARDGQYVRSMVKDEGVGIPRMQQERIFQRFFRASNSARYQTEGTGIGLYIAKTFIESLGGKIGFASEEEKGSTFWFTLPIKE